MGSFEDDDNRNDINSRNNNLDVDSRDFATQQIDSQYPGGDLEGDDDFRFLTNTMPVNDSYLFEDDFETQYANLAGETQVVDLDDETQILDDLDCMKNMPIEFLNDFYTENVAVSKCEGVNKNEALGETQVLSQDDQYVKVDDGDSVGLENTIDNCPPRQGSFSGGFTSIRAASIRASGLAARESGANRSSGPTTSDKSSVEQETCTKNDHNECIEDTEDLRNSNKGKVASATVRKLFKDDEFAETGQPEDDADDNLDMASGNCLAGLSYADSQEPGELSQAHALEVVDKFLDLNVMDFDEGLGTVVKKAEKPKVVSGAKGSRELAKKSSILEKTDGECGIYDWDDNREDECGGDFFLKKKELFFDNGGPKPRCHTEPRKRKGDEKERRCTKNGSTYSVSGSKLCKLRAKGKTSRNCGEKVLQKNLIKDLDEQLNEPNVVEKEKSSDVRETNDVGPDTQLAAEAMETLCFEVNSVGNNCNIPDKANATRKNQLSDITTRSEECSTGVVTRQAKRIKRARVSTGKESSLSSKKSDLTVSKHPRTKSAERSEKKRVSEDHLGFSVPVAHRTRKCVELNRPEVADKLFDNNNNNSNHVISARVTRKSTAVKDKIVGSNKPSASDINVVDNIIKRKRSRNNLSHQKGASDRTKAGARSSEKRGSEKSTDVAKRDDRPEASPPAGCRTPISSASPICMGDEYHKQSCRKSLSRSSLTTEIDNAVVDLPGLYSGKKESRKRKDITNIRVLFSQHLDEDVVKQQKKVLAKLGGAVATFMSDATHFVADEFVRTRNMLEAIASGKPVVTHLWLECCGQASCLIDEKNYVLRDSRKEREFGFCLPVSLSRARQHPLLQGQKVLVTPNTKPGKDILANLVKAVHGLAVERVGRSALKDEKLPDDLLILSCEEDYDICVPFLQKGGAVYSSELLLNGIVKQKLEFERHRLFDDYVKKTRSTIWMKKKSGYLPVSKCK